MPQVPVYRQQEQLAPLRRADSTAPSADQFAVGARQTGQLAQGLGAFGDAMDRVAQREATTEVFAAEAEVKKQWLDFSGQLQKNRQGINAKGVTQEVEKWWADTAPKLLEGAKSGRARQMLTAAMQRLQLGAMEQYQGFENRQLEIASDAAFQANIDTSITAISNEPEKAGQYRAGIEAALRTQAQVKGWDEATLNQRRDAALQAAAKAHYNGILRTRGAEGAQAFLDDPNNGLSPSERDALATKLKPLVADERGEKFAASVASLPLDQQVAQAQKIEDPDVRKAAVARIEQNEQLRGMAVRAREAQASDTIWQLIGQGVPMGRLPKDVLAQMDGKERAQVTEHYRAAFERAKSEANGRAVKTDWGVYEDLYNRIAAGETVRVSAYQDRLAGAQIDDLVKMQQKLRNPGDGAKRDSLFSTKDRVDNALVELNIDPKKDPETAGRLRSEIDRRIVAESEAKKRPLTPTEEQAVLDEVLKDKVYVKGMFGSSEKPAVLLDPNDASSAYVNAPLFDSNGQPKTGRNGVALTTRQSLAEIQPGVRQTIVDALRAAGVPATEANIARLYAKQKALGNIK